VPAHCPREKLAQLDVQRITPAEGDQLEPKLHAVCGSIETPDEHLHGRIGQLVTPGIVYRGKVLQQARIVLFRRKNPS
jgi:molecular chaperone GrpE (heat shock protein)